jgi:hypothetical protein
MAQSVPSTLGQGSYHLGVWFSYANQVLTLESEGGEQLASPIEHQYSVDYLATLGLHERIDLGLSLPTVLHQSGESSELLGIGRLPRSAYGDLRIDLKTLLVRATGGGFSSGSLTRVTLPTATHGSFAAHDGPSSEFLLLGQQSFERLALVFNGGARFRKRVRALDETLGYDLPWALGLSYLLLGPASGGTALSVGAEAHGRLGLAPRLASEVASPVLAGLWLQSRHDAWMFVLAGEAAVNSALGGPRFRAGLSIGFSADALPK